MITYPVDVQNTKWAVYRLSTGQIIARNQTWPVADGSAITGLDPDYVYMLQITATPPDYDSRLYILQGTEESDPASNELRMDWNTIERSAEERKAAAENEEVLRMAALMRLERLNIQTALVVGGILHHAAYNQQIPAKMWAVFDDFYAKAQKLWDNRDRLNEIFSQIDAGQQPDLDDWTW